MDETEAVWAEVEEITFKAIVDVAKLLATLPDNSDETIQARLDAIAVECINRVETNKNIH